VVLLSGSAPSMGKMRYLIIFRYTTLLHSDIQCRLDSEHSFAMTSVQKVSNKIAC
jgi:hypothetical protein